MRITHRNYVLISLEGYVYMLPFPCSMLSRVRSGSLAMGRAFPSNNLRNVYTTASENEKKETTGVSRCLLMTMLTKEEEEEAGRGST